MIFERKTDSRLRPRLVLVLAIVVSCAHENASAQVDFEGPPINYLTAEVRDPVAKLAEELKSGNRTLWYDPKFGYLPAALEALEVPIDSQTLVFSKTSLQLQRISPRHPRAIYFNDDTYVGFCIGGDVLEFATTDPKQGAMFYTLKQDADGSPRFIRDQGQCLSCHATNRTQGVPGFLVRSVFADRAGHPILGSGTFTSDHTSPFAERWGGWYVTGNHGSMRHMGNRVYTEEDSIKSDREAGANLESLSPFIFTTAYLGPHSDIVALMVMEHQTQMHNAIAAANYETRHALYQSFQMNQILGREPEHVSESAVRRIDATAARVLRYLLMCEEYKLEDKISGTSGFAESFSSKGIKDSKGRSLRDLDLTARLFRYPCSYLIYSQSFDALPDEVRKRVCDGLVNILEGRDQSPTYAHLTPSMRRDILDILRDTKPEIF